MGANAATKLYKVVENVERILAIELMNAVQAIAFRKHRSSDFIENLIDSYRSEVDFLNKDRLLYIDITKSTDFISLLEIDDNLL
jgi:histidine ammonia-lyase